MIESWKRFLFWSRIFFWSGNEKMGLFLFWIWNNLVWSGKKGLEIPRRTPSQYHDVSWTNYRREFRNQTSDTMDRLKSRGGKSQRGEAKRGAEPSGQMRDEKLHTIVARSTFGSKEAKKEPHVRTAFQSWHLEKVHAVVARSQVKNWQVRSTFASCECTPLWREAHSQVNMCQKQ